ncbi:MAG: hypothetical protein ACJ75F_13915, partial [Flavisolibacter sp.]
MKHLLPFIFCCLGICAQAQNLTGFWKGTLMMGGGCFAVNNIELQLHFVGDSVYGDSYHYENVNFYVKKK